MVVGSQVSPSEPMDRIKALREQLHGIRQRARGLFESGATGVQVAAALSDGTDEFLRGLLNQTLLQLSEEERQQVASASALVAVGGSGRGELAPFSDTDLLFLYDNQVKDVFIDLTSQMVRDCWDVGLKLGHSVRTVADSLAMCRQEPQFATSLVHARLLWGSSEQFLLLQRQFNRRIVKGRLASFTQDCINGRLEEREEHGATVLQLEPDIKRSLGGLRDVHLIRWLGAAAYGAGDLDSLRLRGVLSRRDARELLTAYEFLLRIRADLHFHANRAQDVVTRDEQLRITRARGIEDIPGRRGVERFMQEYFLHSTVIADAAHRFVREHRPKSIASRVFGAIVTHRFNDIFKRTPDGVTVVPSEQAEVCQSLERILQLYHSAALYREKVAPGMLQRIKAAVPELDQHVSYEATRIFRRILRASGGLGQTLRSMYETGVLEILLPPMRHARGLLQFNQYHSYTVDEHTFRAIETMESFEHDPGPVGDAYRAIRHKATLHLALLLHDVGKGFDEDHSEVGRRIAENVGQQYQMSDHKREMMVYLVHRHLQMAHIALRRDISDPQTLMSFARSVGSPEILRMLYVLTAADITAVGPGTWTEWKGELLTDLFNRAMLVLGGEHYQQHERKRLQAIKDQVKQHIAPPEPPEPIAVDAFHRWVDETLDAFSSHYFIGLDVEKIVEDLDVLRGLGTSEIVADAAWDSETETVEYRVITRGTLSEGCFHKLCGALTAKRLEILTAHINTSLEGVVVDRFRVLDKDYEGHVPQDRIDEVCEALAAALRGEAAVEELFLRNKRYGTPKTPKVVDDEVSRVVIDNESSEYATIIDVFAHDRPGLLFTLARAIYRMGLSVNLAIIGTHLDQVVDVFYVTDSSGQRIGSGDELRRIRDQLTEVLRDFESSGYEHFVR